MPLNKQRGQMYPWVTHTLNIIRGCQHDCLYCYLKSMRGYDMTPRLVERELWQGLGKGKTIFVGSTSDMFGEWVPEEWIGRVLRLCNKYPENTYLFQSKNPMRFHQFISHFPPKTILGTTLETDIDVIALRHSRAPTPRLRAYEMEMIAMGHENKFERMISIEPILEFSAYFVDMIRDIRPSFVSVGADSKNHNLQFEPPGKKIAVLIRLLSEFTEVKIKSNLRRLLK